MKNKFLLTLVSILSFFYSHAQCDRQRDSLALVSLYNSTDGPNWYTSWDLSEPMTSWYGIELNEDGCVYCIDLDGVLDCYITPDGIFGNNLSGTLPELSLSELEFLSLAYNDLRGGIPEFFETPLLTGLDLSNNHFSGWVPYFEMSDQENMHVRLDNNNLSGCYSNSICDLWQISLSGNPALPWQGDLVPFCNGSDQRDAPCDDRNPNTTDDRIDECVCGEPPQAPVFAIQDITLSTISCNAGRHSGLAQAKIDELTSDPNTISISCEPTDQLSWVQVPYPLPGFPDVINGPCDIAYEVSLWAYDECGQLSSDSIVVTIPVIDTEGPTVRGDYPRDTSYSCLSDVPPMNLQMWDACHSILTGGTDFLMKEDLSGVLCESEGTIIREYYLEDLCGNREVNLGSYPLVQTITLGPPDELVWLDDSKLPEEINLLFSSAECGQEYCFPGEWVASNVESNPISWPFAEELVWGVDYGYLNGGGCDGPPVDIQVNVEDCIFPGGDGNIIIVTYTVQNPCGNDLIYQFPIYISCGACGDIGGDRVDYCSQSIPLCDLYRTNLASCLPPWNGSAIQADQPSPLCGGGQPQNMSWYSFTAGSPSLTITVEPTECLPGRDGKVGVQLGIYDGCNGNCIVWDTDCTGDLSAKTIITDHLIVGQNYYIFIDGCGGAECSIDITIEGHEEYQLPSILEVIVEAGQCASPETTVFCSGQQLRFNVLHNGDSWTEFRDGHNNPGDTYDDEASICFWWFFDPPIDGESDGTYNMIEEGGFATPLLSLPSVTEETAFTICINKVYGPCENNLCSIADYVGNPCMDIIVKPTLEELAEIRVCTEDLRSGYDPSEAWSDQNPDSGGWLGSDNITLQQVLDQNQISVTTISADCDCELVQNLTIIPVGDQEPPASYTFYMFDCQFRDYDAADLTAYQEYQRYLWYHDESGNVIGIDRDYQNELIPLDKNVQTDWEGKRCECPIEVSVFTTDIEGQIIEGGCGPSGTEYSWEMIDLDNSFSEWPDEVLCRSYDWVLCDDFSQAIVESNTNNRKPIIEISGAEEGQYCIKAELVFKNYDYPVGTPEETDYCVQYFGPYLLETKGFSPLDIIGSTEICSADLDEKMFSIASAAGSGDNYVWDVSTTGAVVTSINASGTEVILDLTAHDFMECITVTGSTACGTSTVDLCLSQVSSFSYDLREELCPEDEIIVNGNIYNQSNPVGTEIMQGADGCDSIVNVELRFFQSWVSEIDMILCEGDNIRVGNTIYSEANPTGSETLTDYNGCDSIVNVSLSFMPGHDLDLRCEPEAGGVLFQWETSPDIKELSANYTINNRLPVTRVTLAPSQNYYLVGGLDNYDQVSLRLSARLDNDCMVISETSCREIPDRYYEINCGDRFLQCGLQELNNTTIDNGTIDEQPLSGCYQERLYNPWMYSFVAGGSSASFYVDLDDAFITWESWENPPCQDLGLNISIIEDCGGNCFYQEWQCGNDTRTISVDNLVIGDTYHLVIDGCCESIYYGVRVTADVDWDYELPDLDDVTIESRLTTTDNTTLPENSFCLDNEGVLISARGLRNNIDLDNLKANWQWTITGPDANNVRWQETKYAGTNGTGSIIDYGSNTDYDLIYGGNEILLNFPTFGDYVICLEEYSTYCDMSVSGEPACIELSILDSPTQDFGEYDLCRLYMEEDSWFPPSVTIDGVSVDWQGDAISAHDLGPDGYVEYMDDEDDSGCPTTQKIRINLIGANKSNTEIIDIHLLDCQTYGSYIWEGVVIQDNTSYNNVCGLLMSRSDLTDDRGVQCDSVYILNVYPIEVGDSLSILGCGPAGVQVEPVIYRRDGKTFDLSSATYDWYDAETNANVADSKIAELTPGQTYCVIIDGMVIDDYTSMPSECYLEYCYLIPDPDVGTPCDDNNPLTVDDVIQDDCSCRGEIPTSCRVRDSIALMALYNATNGSEWTNSDNWGTSNPLDLWHGVETDAQGCVTCLDMNGVQDCAPNFEERLGNNLVGELPDEIGLMQQLVRLDLDYNKLTGSIPSTISNMVSLEEIKMISNRLTGELPVTIVDLPVLNRIDLRYNNITGTIPDNIGKLTSLDVLVLSHNNIEGEIPSSLGQLTNLKDIWLDYNNLTGEIPTEIYNLTNLYTIFLQSNELTGTISPRIGNLKELATIDFSDNNLTGEIPKEIGSLPWLMDLFLYSNNLTGEIPQEIADHPELTYISLAENNLTGEIPEGIGRNPFFARLHLYDNNLSGCFPASLSRLCDIDHDFHNNPQLPFSGDFDRLCLGEDEIGASCDDNNPRTFDDVIQADCSCAGDVLTDCRVRDSIALMALYHATNGPEWTNSENWGTSNPLDQWFGVETDAQGCVTCLDLNGVIQCTSAPLIERLGNNLIGELPDEIGLMEQLVKLDLDNNQLTGSIPSTISDMISLEELWIKYNQLTGELPSTLVDMPELRWIDLSSNNISGTLPEDLGKITNLEILVLSDNNIEGEIPPSLGQIANLTDIRLDRNNLTGEIPIEIYNLSNLTAIILQGNELTGTISPRIGDLEELYLIDFSDNNLTGEIPKEIGSLQLLSDLNLYSNNLTGRIPKELADNIDLSYLSLADNNLSGEIPEEIGNIPFLGQIHLNENQLSGCFPATFSRFCNMEYDFSNNPQLPFSGDFDRFCAGEDQIGAPCDDGDPQTSDEAITENCLCQRVMPCEDVYALIDTVLCTDEFVMVNGVVYQEDNPEGQEIIPLSNGCDSIVDIMISSVLTPKAQDDYYTVEDDPYIIIEVLVNDNYEDISSLSIEVYGVENILSFDIMDDYTIEIDVEDITLPEARLYYEICSKDCDDECSEAEVLIEIITSKNYDKGVLTPNNDGVNEVLVIPGYKENEVIPESKISVFNRWGQLVYETTNYKNDWRGNYMSNPDSPLPEGIYYYQMHDKDYKSFLGSRSIIR